MDVPLEIALHIYSFLDHQEVLDLCLCSRTWCLSQFANRTLFFLNYSNNYFKIDDSLWKPSLTRIANELEISITPQPHEFYKRAFLRAVRSVDHAKIHSYWKSFNGTVSHSRLKLMLVNDMKIKFFSPEQLLNLNVHVNVMMLGDMFAGKTSLIVKMLYSKFPADGTYFELFM